MATEVDPKAAEQLTSSVVALKAAAEGTTKAFNEQLKIIMQMRDVMNKMAGTMGDIGGMSTGPLSPELLRYA